MSLLLQSSFGGAYVQQADVEPPLAPAGLSESNITSDGWTASWSSNSEPDLKDYRVYLSSTSAVAGFSVIGVVTANSNAFSGLDADTQYWYYVTARDQLNNESEASEVRTVTTSPLITYLASAPPYPADTIHTAGVAEGDTIEATVLSGTGVEIGTNGSVRATSSSWTLSVRYFDQDQVVFVDIGEITWSLP